MKPTSLCSRSLIILILLCGPALLKAQPAPGAPDQRTPEEQRAFDAVQGKLDGFIVWSSSRTNPLHDIWIMNADGTQQRPLTTSTGAVDWFSRISPDGKWVLFNRSKGGWVPEVDADFPEKWDLWIIGVDGQGEKKVVESATWGNWRPDGKNIVYSRGGRVYTRSLDPATGGLAEGGAGEEMIFDAEQQFKRGVIAQQPNLSPDGKYIAITLRGTQRETGIWDREKKTWAKSGDGCQIDFSPDQKWVFRINPTGNGGTSSPSEVIRFRFENGQALGKVGFFGVPKELRLMDLPGRRSHEYFPKLDNRRGEWLVWGATDRGHDHDLFPYEVYLWKIGEPFTTAARLTAHTGNDRWPDIWLRE